MDAIDFFRLNTFFRRMSGGYWKLCLVWLMTALVQTALASPPASDRNTGEVTVPLGQYQSIEQALQRYRESPVNYALGTADVKVTGKQGEERIHADVSIQLTVQVFDNRWTAIPLLTDHVPLSLFSVNNRRAQLAYHDNRYYWITQHQGEYRLQLHYKTDAQGNSLHLALPKVAAQLEVDLPIQDKSLQVIPSVDSQVSVNQTTTQLQASLPPVQQAQIVWQRSFTDSYTMSRATYQASEKDDALLIEARFEVINNSPDPIKIPLFPLHQIVSSVQLDGEQATVINEHGQLYVVSDKTGQQLIEAVLVVAIDDSQGAPHVRFAVPEVPINQLLLKLDGNKHVNVEQAAHVESRLRQAENTAENKEITQATAYLPATQQVALSWQDAIPEEVQAELRANATTYHLFHAEEGVLHGEAIIDYEVTRGETSQLNVRLPASALVNRVKGLEDAIVDWRTTDQNGMRLLTLFLNRSLLKGNHRLVLDYEVLVGHNDKESQSIAVPLISMVDVVRQRGMVALLASQELTLKPEQEQGMNKVGENQLPAHIRQRTSLKADHTYKYSSVNPDLIVSMEPPVREQGKFDATVDTLISVGDVTLAGTSSIQINVKSGSLMTMLLTLPDNINVLALTSPALRNYEVIEAAESSSDQQQIRVEFTQEMQGQFRMDINYERIMSTNTSTMEVPTLSVQGAEVEHGRLGIEALAAVEIKPLATQQLTSVEVGELPRQLILKTTNPILLAYRYVNPPIQLSLEVTRHKELQTLAANIDIAQYQTLATKDGLVINRASYVIKNNRRQFMRIQLPENSEIWSLEVDGRSEKPAIADDEKGVVVLVKMINSEQGFPLELTYATQTTRMENFGRLTFQLPKPDMVVTKTLWDLYLPRQFRYSNLNTNLEPLYGVAAARYRQSEGTIAQPGSQVNVDIPLEGIHFGFEKLYASQVESGVFVSLNYAPLWIDNTFIAGLIASLLVFIAAWWLARRTDSNRLRLCSQLVAIAAVIAGVWALNQVEAEFPWMLVWVLIALIVLIKLPARRPSQST